jgi:hypothetical protein
MPGGSVVPVLMIWARWARSTRWVLVVLAAVVVAAAVGWALFVPIADSLATHDVGRVTGALRTLRLETARDAARGRLLTFGAGLFAVAALVFTARNFSLSREGQVTDRYTRAIEQLGSDKLDVRIGGIYAMERVARDSARDHPTVNEVLAAFIREHSHERWPPPAAGDDALPSRGTRPDVQAGVTVIGRRNSRNDRRGYIHLMDADLHGADLHGADLIGTNLIGANLIGAILVYADLTRAYLSHANLTGAHLSHANLTGADLDRANLTGAHLDRANLSNADLTRADLTGADLTGADLTRADLTGAIWSADRTPPQGWEREPSAGILKLKPRQ